MPSAMKVAALLKKLYGATTNCMKPKRREVWSSPKYAVRRHPILTRI